MEKRYQVFISSTFQDLQAERQEVMHALLELDCMPSGMELFPAANESQWNFIKKVIDDCDYYILILAGRYGTIGPDGISYTEMEYRYALSTGKPTLAFLHRDTGKIISDKSEKNPENLAKLNTFRDSVGKLAKFWATPEELGSVVSRSLIQLIKSTPAVGWVRANEIADRDATLELLRLRRRVDELESELTRNRISAPKGTESLSQGDQIHSFKYSFSATSEGEFRSKGWTSSIEVSWNELFGAVAPLMINEASEPNLRTAINGFIGKRERPSLLKHKDLKNATLSDFTIENDEFQTIKIQFRALGLIAKNEKNRSVKDSGTYWTLTPYGDEVMTRLRAVRRVEEAEPHTPTKPKNEEKRES